jgi:uncharacterized membrane-anchored protein
MKLKLLALVLALQCAWLLATTYTQERALRVGQLILLETRPVDPRDMLRGDYVILSYKISDVLLSAFTPARTNVLRNYARVNRTIRACRRAGIDARSVPALVGW